MHHGKCVTHVPWCMSGSLTRGGGENVQGIPGTSATRKFHILEEAHGISYLCPDIHGSWDVFSISWGNLKAWFKLNKKAILGLTYSHWFYCKERGDSNIVNIKLYVSASSYLFAMVLCSILPAAGVCLIAHNEGVALGLGISRWLYICRISDWRNCLAYVTQCFILFLEYFMGK